MGWWDLAILRGMTGSFGLMVRMRGDGDQRRQSTVIRPDFTLG